LGVSIDEVKGTQMEILSIIQDFNNNNISPALDDLMERAGTVKAHVEFCLSELSAKAYIEKASVSTRDIYFEDAYNSTEKGRHALELYVAKVKGFKSSLMDCYYKNEKRELYGLVVRNNEFLYFGYERGLITSDDIQKIAKALDMSPERVLRSGDSDGTSDIPGWFPVDP
jgi:hypothetical protein